MAKVAYAPYRRADTFHLTVALANPHHPGRFDAYLVLQAPDGSAWFYDGRRPASSGSWAAWVRDLTLPARATGRFAVPLSTFSDGAYRWHVVLTEPGVFRGLARAAASFTIAP